MNEENKYTGKKKNKRNKSPGHHSGSKSQLNDDDLRQIDEELKAISNPYCNFSNYFSSILHY
jgi:hypothetical protein